MPFTKFEFKKDWTESDKNSDRYFKTYEDSEEQVREDLQLQPNELKSAIHRLIDELESASAADMIGESAGADGSVVTLAQALSSIRKSIAALDSDITNLMDAQVPDGLRSSQVDLTIEGWDGTTYTVDPDTHRRKSSIFGYQIWVDVGGDLRSDTWVAAGTSVVYDKGNIVLTAEEPYAGKIVFFGV